MIKNNEWPQPHVPDTNKVWGTQIDYEAHRAKLAYDKRRMNLRSIGIIIGAGLALVGSRMLVPRESEIPHDAVYGTTIGITTLYSESDTIRNSSEVLAAQFPVEVMATGCDELTNSTMLQIRQTGEPAWAFRDSIQLDSETDISEIPVIETCK